MKTIALSEAQTQLAALIEEVGVDEPIAITCDGVVKAILTTPPPQPQRPLAEIFESLRGSIHLPPGVTFKVLIEEGRR